MVLVSGLATWLFGCFHRKTAFPVTFPATAGADGRTATPSETYVVCLECGHHIPYDWTKGLSRNNHARSARPLSNARCSEPGSEPRALESGWRYFITYPKMRVTTPSTAWAGARRGPR